MNENKKKYKYAHSCIFYIPSNKKWLSGFSLISRLCFDIFDPSSMWLSNKSIQKKSVGKLLGDVEVVVILLLLPLVSFKQLIKFPKFA